MIKLKTMAIAVFATMVSYNMDAQTLKQFTLEDLNFGGTNYHNMVPRNMYLTWWGDQLMYQNAEDFGTVDIKTGKNTALATINDINNACGDNSTHSTMDVKFPYPDRSLALIENGQWRLLYNWKKKNVEWKQNLKEQSFSDWNKTTRATAYVCDDQLYVVYGNGKVTQLTTDGSRDIVYGQTVHRNEWGIDKGTFWSPDGQRLAFYRMDQSMVTDYPQVNTFSRIAEYTPDKYPMAGMASHKVTVGIYDMNTGKTIYLDAGDPTDRFFANIAWSPDSKTLYMNDINRDQTDAYLCAYDVVTGKKLRELVHEHDDKYVQPKSSIVFLPWDNSKFLLQSQRDGFNHLYLYDMEGNMLKQLTSGSWIVESIEGFNTKDKSVVIISTEASPLQNNLYAVNIATGQRTRLDDGKGVHVCAALSATGKYAIDKYSEPDVPRNIDVVNTTTAKQNRIMTAADPWKGYAVPEYSCGTIKAADGITDLYYRMVKPVGFDPTKKYPTVVYVYGGPNIRNVDARWHYASRSWETYMAQKGYLLFILDNRGSSDRGLAFEQATFRRLGQEEMKDQMCGVEFLKSLPYVDSNRLGVHGWSYGGYMTISLMTTYPDVFKVGVAGGPVIDWKWYEVMYGERYMDTPQTNAEGFAETSLLNKAKNLKGKLQIIIGMNDDVVVPQNALQFINACTEAGTQPDFFVYPGEGHNMRGHKSVHLHERITQYFEDYLK